MDMTTAVPLRNHARTVTEAIESRRAIKAFDPQHRLTDAEIDQLLSLATLSPTAWNIQNWRFVVVRDPALRAQLRAVAFDQPQVTEASLLIVLWADLKAWDKQPGRYWRHAPQPVQDFVLPAIRQYYTGRAQATPPLFCPFRSSSSAPFSGIAQPVPPADGA